MTLSRSKIRTGLDNSGIVDRDSHEPAYIQICNLLKEEIAKGVYLPGSRLPSESALRDRHKVSPMTVRRSIKMLIDQGVVTTIQGSGTFVKAPDLGGANFSMKEFYSIFQDHEKTKIRLLEAKTLKADRETASRLCIEEGKRIILLKRLVLKEGDPIILHKEFLIYDPARPIIETELEVTTLYGLFERTGQTAVKRGDLWLEAMVLSPEEARLLNTMPLKPAFRIEHLFYDFDETPMIWGQFICRGDQLRFKAVVGVSPA